MGDGKCSRRLQGLRMNVDKTSTAVVEPQHYLKVEVSEKFFPYCSYVILVISDISLELCKGGEPLTKFSNMFFFVITKNINWDISD